jgi:hypothetical protein
VSNSYIDPIFFIVVFLKFFNFSIISLNCEV